MRTDVMRVGARTEALIVLPAALLLLICLSFFTLFSHRVTIERALIDRGDEATRLARSVADRLTPGQSTTPEMLRRLAPQAWAVALVDDSDVPFVYHGDLAMPAAPPPSTEPRGLGPWLVPPATATHVVTGYAAFTGGDRAARVRIDLSARTLRAKARSLRVLWPLVLLTNAAMAALLLLYLRRWLVPFDRLVARARRTLPSLPASEPRDQHDEMALLLDTFDHAMAALQDASPPSPDDDELAAFQRALGRSLESGVLLLDQDATVLALNEVGAGLLGLAQDHEGRAPLAEVLAPHPAMVALLLDATRRQKAVHRHELAVEVDGASRMLGLTLHPLRRDDGAVRGYLALFADLTAVQQQAERRRTAENLAQVGTLAAGVAHEMRNGLATLRGYLGLIERDPAEAGTQETLLDYVGEMRREADHLQRVLDDFLRFARPGTVRREQVDLKDIAERCAVDPALDGVAVRVRAAAEASLISQGDAQLLEQALRNLVRNAADAQREAEITTAIEIVVAATDNGHELRVDDRGPGISEALATTVFDPFVTGRAGGVGLGLALARRVVVLHGGTLTLEPRASGGTRARMQLPGNPVTDGNDRDPSADGSLAIQNRITTGIR